MNTIVEAAAIATELDFDLVASLIHQVAQLEETGDPSQPYLLIYNSIPIPAPDLSVIVEWFNMWGQRLLLEQQNRWSEDRQEDLPYVSARSLKPGMLIRSQWSNEPPMRVRHCLSETDWHLSFSFSYAGTVAIDSTTVHKLWQFQLLEE